MLVIGGLCSTPVRLFIGMVGLFGFYADELLTEATLLVRDRKLLAGALLKMVCAKIMHRESFLPALPDGKLPDHQVSLTCSSPNPPLAWHCLSFANHERA